MFRVCYLSYATPRETSFTDKSLVKEFQASQVLRSSEEPTELFHIIDIVIE